MNKSLDRDISINMLIRFSMPTIIAMIFMGIYSSVDAVFVARLIGEEALAAVNIVIPLIMIILAIGSMLGTGGNALVSKKMGECKDKEARQNFTLLTIFAFIISSAITILGSIFLKPLMYLLGANDNIIGLCTEYAIPMMVAIPFGMIGGLFQQFFITEGRPNLGLISSMIGGMANIILDYLFIGVFKMGVQGASMATSIGYSIPALIGFFYFLLSRKQGLYFTKPKWNFYIIKKSSANGISEMISILASALTMLLMNNILIRLVGEDGVSAVAIITTVHGILTSAYMGYSFGVAPIISFNYGKKDTDRLKKIYSISLYTIFAMSITTTVLSFILSEPLVRIFSNEGTAVFEMAVVGFRISAIGFMFMGFNSFSSAMFTAFNNAKVSVILAISRTLLFILITLMTLPFIFGVKGVWLAIPIAEIMAIFMTIYYFKKMKSVYSYA